MKSTKDATFWKEAYELYHSQMEGDKEKVMKMILERMDPVIEDVVQRRTISDAEDVRTELQCVILEKMSDYNPFITDNGDVTYSGEAYFRPFLQKVIV